MKSLLKAKLHELSKKNILNVSKKLLLLLSCLLSLQAVAQPNIQKSLHLAEKHCWPYMPGYFKEMTYVPNAGLYGVLPRGNVLTPGSDEDILLFKIDTVTYDTLWSKVYGGSKKEYNSTIGINALPNGNILISGVTRSFDLDFASNPDSTAQAIFFMELDTAGLIQKTTYLNGNDAVQGKNVRDVIVDIDGNIYATGWAYDTNWDFAHTGIDKDGFIVKLDTNLQKEWIEFWVGQGSDQPFGIGFVHGGNIAVSGTTGDLITTDMLGSQSKGGSDLFVEVFTPQGATVWKKRFGGKHFDDGQKVVFDPVKKDIYVVGITNSATGDIGYHTANSMTSDTTELENDNIWILRLDTMGNLVHSKAYGTKQYGTNFPDDTKYDAAIWHNNTLWIGARSLIGGGDMDSGIVNGANRLFIGTIDDQCNLTAKHTFNETSAKYLTGFVEWNNDLFFTGRSEHQTSVPINTFSCDHTPTSVSFMLKMIETPLNTEDIAKKERQELFKIYPNPSSKSMNIELDATRVNKKNILSIYNSTGRRMLRKRIKNKHTNIDIAAWSHGVYYIQLQSNTTKQTKQFIKH